MEQRPQVTGYLPADDWKFQLLLMLLDLIEVPLLLRDLSLSTSVSVSSALPLNGSRKQREQYWPFTNHPWNPGMICKDTRLWYYGVTPKHYLNRRPV